METTFLLLLIISTPYVVAFVVWVYRQHVVATGNPYARAMDGEISWEQALDHDQDGAERDNRRKALARDVKRLTEVRRDLERLDELRREGASLHAFGKYLRKLDEDIDKLDMVIRSIAAEHTIFEGLDEDELTYSGDITLRDTTDIPSPPENRDVVYP